jgi:2-dehydro-3-deoxyphosphogalactonate aldolase
VSDGARTHPAAGLIGILRGVTTDTVVAVCTAVVDAGFRVLEIPLNSPDPFTSIRLAREALPDEVLVGAGTVLKSVEVERVAAACGRFVVAPNFRIEVVEATVRLGLGSYPGVATPSEALDALDAGATALKVFPAAQVGVAGLRAWRSVLPAGTGLFPVGGVGPDDFPAWAAAGATGFGLGSELYRPDYTLAEIGERARRAVDGWNAVNEV